VPVKSSVKKAARRRPLRSRRLRLPLPAPAGQSQNSNAKVNKNLDPPGRWRVTCFSLRERRERAKRKDQKLEQLASVLSKH